MRVRRSRLQRHEPARADAPRLQRSADGGIARDDRVAAHLAGDPRRGLGLWAPWRPGRMRPGRPAFPAGCARAAGTAVALKAPLNASAVTATAAATTTAASTRQRLRTHSLIVVARTRPHDGAAAAGLAESGTGFPVSLVGSSCPVQRADLHEHASERRQTVVLILSRHPPPHVSATHLPQQSTPACQDQPKTPIGNECIAQRAEACASFACLRNHLCYRERQSASCAELEALIPRRRSDLRCE